MNSRWIWSLWSESWISSQHKLQVFWQESKERLSVSDHPPPPSTHTCFPPSYYPEGCYKKSGLTLGLFCSQINSSPTLGCSETRRCCPLQASPRVLRWLSLQPRRAGRLESRGKGTTWTFVLQATSPAQLHGGKCQLQFKVPLHDPNLWDPIKILLPYINIANQHVVHIKLTQVIYQLYLNF